jgi:DNA-binding MarR family transcriptional regulator
MTSDSKHPGLSVDTGACLCLAARKAARAVTDLYDLVLSPAGIKATQFSLLNAIGKAERISQHDLGTQLAVAPETLSRRLSTAKASGWIELRGADSREHMYALTQNGRERLQEALPYWERSQSRLRSCLGSEKWEAALSVLEQLLEAAREAETARLPNTAHCCRRSAAIGNGAAMSLASKQA